MDLSNFVTYDKKFEYSDSSLQKDEIENLEKELESQSKLNNIKLNDMRSAFGMSD